MCVCVTIGFGIKVTGGHLAEAAQIAREHLARHSLWEVLH